MFCCPGSFLNTKSISFIIQREWTMLESKFGRLEEVSGTSVFLVYFGPSTSSWYNDTQLSCVFERKNNVRKTELSIWQSGTLNWLSDIECWTEHLLGVIYLASSIGNLCSLISASIMLTCLLENVSHSLIIWTSDNKFVWLRCPFLVKLAETKELYFALNMERVYAHAEGKSDISNY
jgi:hypothetical protein